jgi:vitamin B12 transporter
MNHRLPRLRPRGAGAVALAALTALLVTAPLAAQQPGDTIVLDEIVVTATRLPLPRAAVASAVTVLTGDALRAAGLTNLLDALRAVPGATLVQGGSYGTPASFFLRGGESDYVRVLVDGVPVNEPGGAYDFAHLTLDNVERVEIVRGPASVLYGSDAVTGVVQVFTRSGAGAARWRVSGDAGSYGTARVAAAAAGGGAPLGFSLAASRFESAGTSAFNSGYRRHELSALLRAAAGAATDARLTFRFDEHRTRFPTDGAGRAVDHNQFTTGRQATVGLDLRHAVSSGLELRALLGAHTGFAGYDNRPDGPADTLGYFADVSGSRVARRSADLRAVAHLAPGTSLSAGGTIERQTVTSHDSASSQWGPSLADLDRGRRNAALYAQLVADPGGRVAVNLGARLDRNQHFGSFATWRAGLSWRPVPRGRVRAAVGTALKEPTFFETFGSPWVTGNEALRPERSRSWEVGAEFELGRPVSVSATVFAQRFTDLIQYTFAPPAPGQPNYFNIAAARSSGLETELSIALAPGLTARGHYTYLSTAVTDAGFATAPGGAFAQGRALLRRPAHAAGVALGWSRAGTALHASVDVVGRRDDMDFSAPSPVRVRQPAYARVDVSGIVPALGRGGPAGVAATVRVENLFGARYQEVRGFPARGRTVLVGLRAEGGF